MTLISPHSVTRYITITGPDGGGQFFVSGPRERGSAANLTIPHSGPYPKVLAYADDWADDVVKWYPNDPLIIDNMTHVALRAEVRASKTLAIFALAVSIIAATLILSVAVA